MKASGAVTRPLTRMLSVAPSVDQSAVRSLNGAALANSIARHCFETPKPGGRHEDHHEGKLSHRAILGPLLLSPDCECLAPASGAWAGRTAGAQFRTAPPRREAPVPGPLIRPRRELHRSRGSPGRAGGRNALERFEVSCASCARRRRRPRCRRRSGTAAWASRHCSCATYRAACQRRKHDGSAASRRTHQCRLPLALALPLGPGALARGRRRVAVGGFDNDGLPSGTCATR
jgi:hypothetical protein